MKKNKLIVILCGFAIIIMTTLYIQDSKSFSKNKILLEPDMKTAELLENNSPPLTLLDNTPSEYELTKSFGLGFGNSIVAVATLKVRFIYDGVNVKPVILQNTLLPPQGSMGIGTYVDYIIKTPIIQIGENPKVHCTYIVRYTRNNEVISTGFIQTESNQYGKNLR